MVVNRLPELPRLPRSLLWARRIFVLAFIVMTFGIQIHPLADPDIYVHMRDGRYWVDTGFDFGPDPFAYTIPDKSIDKIEVLFSVGLHGLWQLGGFRLLILVKAALMTACFLLLGLLMYRRWPNWGVAIFLAAAIQLTPTLFLFFRERPYVFTYLFLLLSLLLMSNGSSASGPGRTAAEKRWWIIPALVPLWVNLHPGFLLLFGVLGAHLAEAFVLYLKSGQKDQAALGRIRTLAVIALLSFLSGALNPLGFSIYTYAFQHLGSEAFARFITEWNPPQFAKHYDFFLLLGLVWALQLFTLRRARIADLLLLTAFSYLSLSSYRNVPLFIFAALPPVVGQARELLQRLGPRRLTFPGGPRLWYGSGAAALLAVLAIAVASSRAGALRELPDYYPKNGIRWLTVQSLPGRVFAPMAWNGYLGWRTNGQTKVFMDGRLMLFAEGVFEDYIMISTGAPKKCLPLLDQYAIQVILTYTEDPTGHENHLKLFSRLSESGQWALVYWDHICHIYLRRTEANAPMIREHEYRAVTPWKPSPYHFDLSDLDATYREVRRAAQAAPESYLPLFFEGQLLMNQRSFAEATATFQSSLALEPNQYTAHYNLGSIYYQVQEWAEAEKHLRAALAANPGSGHRREIMKLLEKTKQHRGRAR